MSSENNKNDRITVHGINFVGLEEALLSFSEETLNSIVDNVFAIITRNDKMSESDFQEHYVAIHRLLKKDYSFNLEEDDTVRFALTLVFFHRQNAKLHGDLLIYLQAFKDDVRDETVKRLEKRLGLSRKVLHKQATDEQNVDNMLGIIAQNFKNHAVPYK